MNIDYYDENVNQYDLIDERRRPGFGIGRPGAGFGRPGFGIGRPGAGFGRPGFGIGRPFGFGYPFITGLAAGALLRPQYPYYYPYPSYPYYYPVPTPYPVYPYPVPTPYPYQGPNYNLPGVY